jgi:hypothetical protein
LTIPFTFSGVPTDAFTANPATQTVIAAGATTGTISITATDNAVVDAARTLTIALTPPSGAAAYQLGTANATMPLVDNDVGVTSVSSSNGNGTYHLGDTISISVTFSATVTVSGIPKLILSTGAIARLAAYASGSGTDTLTFTYVVQANDASSDLDYATTTSLSGNISSGGVPAVLTLPTPGSAGSLAANKALVIDGSLSGGKPAPGVVDNSSGGGCGLGSGFAALGLLFMLTGIALSVRRNRP